jgi:hypothetical protein
MVLERGLCPALLSEVVVAVVAGAAGAGCTISWRDGRQRRRLHSAEESFALVRRHHLDASDVRRWRRLLETFPVPPPITTHLWNGSPDRLFVPTIIAARLVEHSLEQPRGGHLAREPTPDSMVTN